MTTDTALSFARPRKILPVAVTSYDLLKMTALLLMVVDHTGYYFHDQQLWWRAVGRICVPIWFFLIGYARSRDLSARMWVGGALLMLGDVLFGRSVFALNVLFSMVFVRFLIDPVMQFSRRGFEPLVAVCVILLFLILPTSLLFEYGTQGLLLAMFGYMMRHHPKVADIKNTDMMIKIFALFSFIHFFVIQSFCFMFTGPQMAVMGAGLVLVFHWLYHFTPMELPRLSRVLPGGVAWMVRFMGRRTLEIYVAHLFLFKFAAMLLYPAHFSFLHWTWML